MNPKLLENIKLHFKKVFKTKPLMVFAPGRINLIGEHTDYNNGFVFPAAIDKGIVTAISKADNNFSTIIALDVNNQLELHLDQLEAIENGDWKNYVIGVVAEIQKHGKTFDNFNIVFSGNIPSGAGLSSSAALENSIVFALNELFSLELSKKEMIYISQKAEHNYVGVKCGIMDQYASMFGEKNTALLLDCRSLKSTPFKIDLKDYTILLINSNVSHTLAESAYNERRKTCEKIAKKINKKSLREVSIKELQSIKSKVKSDEFDKALFVLEENERVLSASDAIINNDLALLGKLLFDSHDGLEKKYQVSCAELDFLVSIAKSNPNIIGSRMMGGGFGGCTINIIKKNAIKSCSKFIQHAYLEQFQKECSIYSVQLSNGTHIIS